MYVNWLVLSLCLIPYIQIALIHIRTYDVNRWSSQLGKILTCENGKYSKETWEAQDGLQVYHIRSWWVQNAEYLQISDFSSLNLFPYCVATDLWNFWKRHHLSRWNSSRFPVRWIRPECCSFSSFPANVDCTTHTFYAQKWPPWQHISRIREMESA